MRGFLSSSTGVAACAALVLPLSLSAGALAAPAHSDRPVPPVHPAEAGRAGPPNVAVPDAPDAPRTPGTPGVPDVPGVTQSLPIPAAPDSPATRTIAPNARERTLHQREVQPFSLVGVVWEDAGSDLHGTVQVRTRDVRTGAWSGWHDLETHTADHGADPGSAEGASGRLRGATAPLWVGASDGVEVRVRPEDAAHAGEGEAAPLPRGLRLELVDPGEAPTPADPGPAPGPRALAPAADEGGAAPRDATAKYVGPRPSIVTRKNWGADESLREGGFAYTSTVKAAFVHHSSTGNNYTCKQAPSVLRGIYRYHVVSSGWRDFGYNFAIDKCGTIYEGRAGGVTKAVLGAHTLGFNSNTMGVAVLGTFTGTNPPAAVQTAISRLTAWKLGLFGRNPAGKVTLTSGGSGKYKKGRNVTFGVIAGHRDGVSTDCPGTRLYNKLGSIRTAAAKYQGRP
ncbi:N-acetylmuramoyl-L-alanine amidase [Streptomyces sp. NPDC003860]